jgi:hypothetical protein
MQARHFRRQLRRGDLVKTFAKYAFWTVVAGLIVGSAGTIRAHAATQTEPVNVCTALRDRISLANIETALEATGLSPFAAGNYAGIVIRTQCPDMISYVTGQIV